MVLINHFPRDRKMMDEDQFRRWLMEVADANGDGCVSKQELREALRTLGLHNNWWKATRAMAHADLNKNRLVDGDGEIKKLMDYARRRWGIVVVDTRAKKE